MFTQRDFCSIGNTAFSMEQKKPIPDISVKDELKLLAVPP